MERQLKKHGGIVLIVGCRCLEQMGKETFCVSCITSQFHSSCANVCVRVYVCICIHRDLTADWIHWR